MSKHHHDIQIYLSELKHVLKGQPEGLIQDALNDVENHLHHAVLEDSESSFESVIVNLGSPLEVASQYVQMENESQDFLQGPNTKPSKFNGFFEPLFCFSDYKSLAYYFVALPLSVFYFAWLVLFGLPSIVLSACILGIPVLALFLKVQSFLALFEGQLINALLGGRIPRRSSIKVRREESNKSIVSSLIGIIKSHQGWKMSLYTALQLPLTATYFSLSCLLFVGSLALIATPIVDPVIHYFSPSLPVDLQWYWLPVTSIVGAVGVTLSLHISRAVMSLHSGIARCLLTEH